MASDRATILVVEDQPIAMTITTAVLACAGFRVLEATNADEALAVIEDHADVSVLVTDVNMPGSMDGLGLARRVGERWPGIGIIVVSATIMAKADDLAEGAVFIPKSLVTSRAFVDRVTEFADRPHRPGDRVR